MPHPILEAIRTEVSLEVFLKNKQKVPLFEALDELKNTSLYEHLKQFQKLYHWSLADFINKDLIDFKEKNADDQTLMDVLIAEEDIKHFKLLLLKGEKPTKEMYEATQEINIGYLLRYKPGKNQSSIYEYTNKRIVNLDYLDNMIRDYNDTTDDDSTEAELSEGEQFDEDELLEFQKNQVSFVNEYNSKKEGEQKLSLIAARGVHFVEKHFSKQTRKQVYDTRKQSHTTFSLSTLIDAGYTADDEPEENDAEIKKIHKRNTEFVETLKTSADKKEQKTGGRYPPAARNNKTFESLYWREMQVYINSFDSLFNKNGIQTNFGFASNRNPHLSLSWKTEVAGMYASGIRFGWGLGIRKDPHYRRSTGKPKHPMLGYIDIFEFPLEYVRANGTDRLLAYNAGKIDLSNLYLSEAEIIFHSMISMVYHMRRFVIILPSFDKHTASKKDELYFGLGNAGGSFVKARTGLFNAIGNQPKGDEYHTWISKRSEKAVEAQAKLIDARVNLGLFNEGKVRVYDHGTAVATELPKPK